MATTVTSQIQGITISEAVKAPVRAVSTTNLTLSGLQTVGGVVLATGDRVLVKAQTNAANNGIYNASTSSWTRSKDFDGIRDVVKGTIVIDQSSTNVLYRVTTENPIVIGTSLITFEAVGSTLTQADIGAILYPITPAETAASVTPKNYSKGTDPYSLKRFWSGSGNIDTALSDMIDVALNEGGTVCTIPPGSYNLAATVSKILTPSSGATVATGGLTIQAYGARINFAGSGFALDLSSPNTSAAFYGPLFSLLGLNIYGTAAAAGGIRQSDLNSGRYIDTFVHGCTSGPGFALRNVVNWSENNRFIGCGAVSCKTGMQFSVAGGLNSFARTSVQDFFGASLSDYWFDVQSGSLYDSRFTHISGNFTSLALFSLNACDLSFTVIDGVNTEINGLITLTFTSGPLIAATSATLITAWTHPSGSYTCAFSNTDVRVVTLTNGATTCTWTGGLSSGVTTAANITQAIIWLRDYPQTVGVLRRPILYNVGGGSTFNGTTTIPTWMKGDGTSVNPESQQLQTLASSVPFTSSYGQSTVYESSVSAVRNVATANGVLQTGVALTGFAAPPSGRVTFTRSGTTIVMTVFDALLATSNANTLTLTGIPAEYTPASSRIVQCVVEDNGNATVPAFATVTSGSTITFAMATAYATYSPTGFTTSGTKGLNVGTTLVWQI